MSWRTTLVAPQRRQSALLEPPLMTSHGAHRTIEHPGRSDLIGPALFHQAHHRQRFGHAIGHCILGQDHARNDHHSVAVLRSDQAAFIDDARAVGVAGLRKQVRGWESRHIRRRYGAGQKSGQVWVRTLLQPGLPESPEKSGNPKRYVRSSGVSYNSGFTVTSRKIAGGHPTNDFNAEIVIKLDWGDLAGFFDQYDTYEVAAAVAPRLLQTNFIAELSGHA